MIVCDFDDEPFKPAFPDTDRGHIRDGVLIQTGSGGLFHYNEPDEDFEGVRSDIQV